MYGLVDNQTSGNDWSQSGQPEPAMLHGSEQETWNFPRRAATHGRFFVRHENQIARFEQAQADAVRQIESFYTIRNDADVKEFLQSHKHVTQVLAEAIDHLKKHFEGCMFSLRLKTDEYDDQMLYAAVAWKKEPKKVIMALNAFDDEWWLANAYPASRHLSFTYDLG